MVILLANGIGRFIQRYHQDLLSLLGHGASEREISMIVVVVALLIATVTLIAAMLLTPLVIALARPLLPWVFFRPSDTGLPILAIVAALLVAVLSSRRGIAAFGPCPTPHACSVRTRAEQHGGALPFCRHGSGSG
jgi:hypothetical protein